MLQYSGTTMQSVYKIAFPVRVLKSRIQGKGAYAVCNIPPRRKIGSMGGVIISVREARRRVKAAGGTPLAMVELWNGLALDGTVNGNDLRYINHSCTPNTYMRVMGVHVEFYALREIEPGEELTCDYGPTHHNGKLQCRCGGSRRRGYI